MVDLREKFRIYKLELHIVFLYFLFSVPLEILRFHQRFISYQICNLYLFIRKLRKNSKGSFFGFSIIFFFGVVESLFILVRRRNIFCSCYWNFWTWSRLRTLWTGEDFLPHQWNSTKISKIIQGWSLLGESWLWLIIYNRIWLCSNEWNEQK